MTNNYLLPHAIKKIGLILLVPSMIASLSYLVWPLWERDNFEFSLSPFTYHSLTTSSLVLAAFMLLLIVSLLAVAFSREKDEDEFTAATRCNSMIWATIVNFTIVILCYIFLRGMALLYVSFLNLYMLLALHCLRFNYLMARYRKSCKE